MSHESREELIAQRDRLQIVAQALQSLYSYVSRQIPIDIPGAYVSMNEGQVKGEMRPMAVLANLFLNDEFYSDRTRQYQIKVIENPEKSYTLTISYQDTTDTVDKFERTDEPTIDKLSKKVYRIIQHDYEKFIKTSEKGH
jgi:hypothetical protein